MNRMPSPGFGASKMPLSTSLNSSTELPWASSRRRKSLSLSRQPTISEMNGKSAAQAGSNSTRLPTLAASLRNVIVQVFSRSALENSQLPGHRPGRRGGAGSGAAGRRRVRRLRRQAATASAVNSRKASGGDATDHARQIITPASSAARVSRAPASAAACPRPRPGGCRPPVVPSSGGYRPTTSRDAGTARRCPVRDIPSAPPAR